MSLYPCPCCGMETLDEIPPGTYDICAVCGWEDDHAQYHDPDSAGGANEFSLREAQRTWLRSVNARTASDTGWVEILGRRFRRSPQWRPLDSSS